MGLLSFRGTLTGWRTRQRETLEFNKGKWKVLHQGRNNPRHQYKLQVNWLESRSAEKDLGILVDNKLNVSQRCDLTAKKVNRLLDCIRQSISASEVPPTQHW